MQCRFVTQQGPGILHIYKAVCTHCFALRTIIFVYYIPETARNTNFTRVLMIISVKPRDYPAESEYIIMRHFSRAKMHSIEGAMYCCNKFHKALYCNVNERRVTTVSDFPQSKFWAQAQIWNCSKVTHRCTGSHTFYFETMEHSHQTNEIWLLEPALARSHHRQPLLPLRAVVTPLWEIKAARELCCAESETTKTHNLQWNSYLFPLDATILYKLKTPYTYNTKIHLLQTGL